jgi:hypothetical protein
VSPTERLCIRAHRREREDTERLSLHPLPFAGAVKAALATPKPKDNAQDKEHADGDDS